MRDGVRKLVERERARHNRLDAVFDYERVDGAHALLRRVVGKEPRQVAAVWHVFDGVEARHALEPAQDSIPRTDDERTIACSTTTEASALVDAGFGYALVPAIETMSDPNQKALVWKSGAKATFGAYVRDDARGGPIPRFLEVAEEEYARVKP